jgi:hypothetical protein
MPVYEPFQLYALRERVERMDPTDQLQHSYVAAMRLPGANYYPWLVLGHRFHDRSEALTQIRLFQAHVNRCWYEGQLHNIRLIVPD